MLIKYIIIRDRAICGLISTIFGNGLGRSLEVVHQLHNLFMFERVKSSLLT